MLLQRIIPEEAFEEAYSEITMEIGGKLMKALILNSGRGSRMGGLTEYMHKCMVEIEQETPLIYHQLSTLAQVGITDFVITTGYMSDQLCEYINQCFEDSLRITFIDNPLYSNTNYIYSIYLALEQLRGEDLLLLHGDLYFDKRVLSAILATTTSSVVVDSSLPLPEKDFKAEIKEGLVTQIATYINNENCLACQPLYKLNKEDWLLWAEAIEKFCVAGNTNVYAEEALNSILHQLPLHPVDLNGKLCMEVDTPEDLSLLKSKIAKEGTR